MKVMRPGPAGRLFAGIVVAACLVPAAATGAGAADLTDPTVTTEDGMQVMHLLGHQTDGRLIPKGGAPTPVPSMEPRPGDAFSFTEELRQNGTLVGTDTGLCTILPGDRKAARCEVEVTFPKGTVTVAGEGTEAQKETTYKVTGGTGAYAGASGVVLAKELSETDSDLTFRFTTGGGSGGGPTITTDGAQRVLHLVAESAEAQFIPKGGEPTSEFPDGSGKRPKAGDAFAFTENLKQDGTKVGDDKGRCTFAGPDDPLHCLVTLTFPQGDIVAEGEFVDGRTNTIALTRGTGAFVGIVGTVAVKDIDDDHTDLRLRFTTGSSVGSTGASPGTGGGSQVAVVPAGGAATGGGSTADGANRGLIGVGVVAGAAGAALFGFGRRIGRREA
jgi:hypothetical protein